jgi:hypothetical protein
LGNRDEFRFAGDCAPGGLYKYRRFESKEERDRIKRTLEHGEIYFPSRLELNDPFELKVAFELNADKKAVIAGLVKSAQRAGKAGGAKARQVMEWQAKLRRRDPRELMNYVQREHNKRMETDCFIYCLCAEDDNPILWAHYADSHKGMCIGFDSTVHPFHGACGLDYADKYPTTPFPRVEGGEDKLFLKSALTKSTHWKYENEYRLCSVRFDNPSWHLDLRWLTGSQKEQTAFVDPKTINRIYLGTRMPDPDREELVNFCRRRRPDIRIFAAAPSGREYKLEYAELH